MDDKEKARQYNKEYYQKNKEKVKQKQKEYIENNKEKHKQCVKKWRENNKEKQRIYDKEYKQSEAGKKSTRICDWKRYGIITDDYDALYEKYLNTKNCELCNVVLTTDKRNTKTTRCLDHDHDITDRDNVRNIICHSCNVKRG